MMPYAQEVEVQMLSSKGLRVRASKEVKINGVVLRPLDPQTLRHLQQTLRHLRLHLPETA
jgi:hypothetical protein